MCVRGSYGQGVVPIAVLPTPLDPAFIALGTALGAFFGQSVARALRYDADNRMQLTMDGSYYGTGLALAAYLAANVIEIGLS
jgi:hypothetical protein